jgi:pimeloyl-ACP methyl ester carboxylesterase
MSDLSSPFKSPQGEAEYMAAYEATMRLWTVPYEAADVRSRFGSTHLVVCGPKEAPPVVLLHCFITSLTNWAYNVAALSRDHRIYAPDMMGQPSKSIPDEPIRNREEMAEWLTGLLDALEIRRTGLIGYSYGGFAALNYAMRAPARVSKLILLSPAGGLVPLKKQFYIRGAFNTLGSFIPSLSRFTSSSILHWMVYEPNLEDASFRRLFDRTLDQFSLGTKYFRPGATVIPSPCKDEELRSVRSPTLLLIGRHEALYDPVAAVRRANLLIPSIQTELIKQAGHDLPNSKPEDVNQRISQVPNRMRFSKTGPKSYLEPGYGDRTRDPPWSEGQGLC